jgi:hypothetical protein
MAVRDDFTAGEVLAAADLNDTFASKPPFAYGTAEPSTTVEGFIWYDENEDPPAAKFWDGAAFQGIGGGKVLQVVRATDVTNRSTTSSSFVDAGISVTITPTKSTSAVLIISISQVSSAGSTSNQIMTITDASNNPISGSDSMHFNPAAALWSGMIFAYDTPATTSPLTYKLRFRVQTTGTANLSNSLVPGQMYAIEVSA